MSEASDADAGEAALLGPEPWERHAAWWRSSFTGGADLEYDEQILPLLVEMSSGAARAVDIGAGEAQVARYLLAHAVPQLVAVVGVDPARAQLANARLADTPAADTPAADTLAAAPRTRPGGAAAPLLVRALGEQLPLCDAAVDLAVCCLVIEHVADPKRLIEEAARVLEPGGRFVLVINHPLWQGPGSGLVDDQILGERYWRVGPYLTEGVHVEEVDRGINLAFYHRPLSWYVNTASGAGLHLTRMDEPAPPAAFLVDSVDAGLEGCMPRLLAMRFDRSGEPRGGSPAPWETRCDG